MKTICFLLVDFLISLNIIYQTTNSLKGFTMLGLLMPLIIISFIVLILCIVDKCTGGEMPFYKYRAIPIIVFCLALVPFITGAFPNKSRGTATFIVKDVWETGIVFTSYDAHVVYDGNAENSLVMFRTSTTNKMISDKLKANIGKRVTINYRSWAVSPAWLNSTNEPMEVISLDNAESTK